MAIIASRKDLHQLLERKIDSNEKEMEEQGELADYNPKINIIESNCNVGDIVRPFSNYKIDVRPMQHDKFLYTLAVFNTRHTDETPIFLYLDTMYKRFWKLYNVESSEIINRFIDQFTHNFLHIDTLWMPHQMINRIEKGYINTGFSLKFKQDVLEEEMLSEDDLSQFTMRLWSKGSRPSENLIRLLKSKGYPVTKTSTRLKYLKNGELKFQDEVFYDGSITINNNADIEENIHFVNTIIDRYSESMNKVENERMGFDFSKGYLKNTGSPFELEFSKEHDIRVIANRIINPVKPFRIWGVIHDDDRDDFLRIACVDTHTGDKFDIDIMPRYARVYLPAKACGNVIFRLYTNIQQSLDAGVKLYDQSGEVFN